MPVLEAYVTARAVQPLVSGLRALGHDPHPLLVSTGFDEPTLHDPDARVPMRAVWSLIAQAVDVTGDDNLGLHIAERADPGSLDVHFYAMVSSPTLGQGYERLCRYQRLINATTRVELDVEVDRATLRHVMPGNSPAPRQIAEFLLAVWVRGGRLVTDVDWAPTEVRFAHHAPVDSTAHTELFRSPVSFATGENVLVFPAALLDVPCSRADPALLAVLDRYATELLDRAPSSASVADRARAALAEELRQGRPSAQRLATSLKMSVRTMSRALAADGTSYRQLLAQVRHRLAVRHLGDDRLSIAEIAFLLGFSELSAFHRAFKRWTNKTPVDYRQHHRARTR